MQRSHPHGLAILWLAILNSGAMAAMRILDFRVRVIPYPSSAAILKSGVQLALNLKPASKNESTRIVSIFGEIPTSGAMAARAHSLTFYALARLHRHPRITDAGGFGAFHGAGFGTAGGQDTWPYRSTQFRLSHYQDVEPPEAKNCAHVGSRNQRS